MLAGSSAVACLTNFSLSFSCCANSKNFGRYVVTIFIIGSSGGPAPKPSMSCLRFMIAPTASNASLRPVLLGDVALMTPPIFSIIPIGSGCGNSTGLFVSIACINAVFCCIIASIISLKPVSSAGFCFAIISINARIPSTCVAVIA